MKSLSTFYVEAYVYILYLIAWEWAGGSQTHNCQQDCGLQYTVQSYNDGSNVSSGPTVTRSGNDFSPKSTGYFRVPSFGQFMSHFTLALMVDWLESYKKQLTVLFERLKYPGDLRKILIFLRKIQKCH